MADREAAERAVKEPNPIIDGRKANVNLAYLGAKPRASVQQLNGEFFLLSAQPSVICNSLKFSSGINQYILISIKPQFH